jgi:chromosome segregation ATPase
MTALQERPRAAAAAAVALVVVIAAAMLAGGALAGENPTPTRSSADRDGRVRAERAFAGARRELDALREQVREQGAELATAQAATKRWRERTRRTERQLNTARRRAASQRRRR